MPVYLYWHNFFPHSKMIPLNRSAGYWTLLLFTILTACQQSTQKNVEHQQGEQLFTLLPADSTHIDFSNNLDEAPNLNVLMYEYFYNGGGVGVGDLNGDGLQDLYFTGNMSDCKFYLNKGKMQFEDVTAKSGIAVRSAPWRTGVTIADINGDQKQDIYIAYSGRVRPENRSDQLFINMGNDASGVPHFEEKSDAFGLADSSFTTQVFFFDFDRDGDLDMFSLNHNPQNMPVLDEASTASLLKKQDLAIGVRLYRNNNNHFEDITAKAGLSSSPLTYGLGAGIADLNEDGWPDIYISNDYNVPDYLYINNHDGSFSDQKFSMLGHTSQSSMGNTVTDINNDGHPDIFVLDMLPADNYRQKLLLSPDNYEKFDLIVRSGFYYQYMRNVLQLNNGNGTFSEIGQLAGLSNTDWSWAPLCADFDNDGWKDMYITNGYLRDYTNMDFLKFMNDYVAERGRLNKEDVLNLLKQMPSSNVVNYMFRNNGDLRFTDVGTDWGFSIPSNSNGAAYADLDNDGDLDIIVNNINIPAFVYRNDANLKLKHHYLDVRLKGAGMNTDGIGAKLYAYSKSGLQFLEQMPARGYQSTVSNILHFGLGDQTSLDSIKVIWPGGAEQVLQQVKADQVLTLEQLNAKPATKQPAQISPVFKLADDPLHYSHQTAAVNDFKRQPLLINSLSFSGPCFAKADINGDGLEDLYAGGGVGQPGAIYLQTKNQKFQLSQQTAFDADRNSEDASAVFLDANKDGAMDLYVASGGYHNFQPNDPALQDRLYLNDGKGKFTRATNALPNMPGSKGCVRVTDLNGDGYPDLFVGGRVIPGNYPATPDSWLLVNDGKGNFTDRTADLAPELKKIGMVTDAAWADMNGDQLPDLVLVGDWMPLSIFLQSNGKLTNQTNAILGGNYSGWWNTLLVTDMNGDNKPDIVAGNLGLNSQCRASKEEPAELWFKDFDNNGSIDPILNFYIQHKPYPYVTRDELLDQMSMMRTRFPDYKSYADKSMQEVFTADEMKDAQKLTANQLATTYFESSGNNRLVLKELPVQAQFAPVFTITALDYNHDGNKDLLLCGNMNHARLKFGKYDASYGILLKGEGSGKFSYVNQIESGLQLKGDVRAVVSINDLLLFGINQSPAKAYKFHSK